MKDNTIIVRVERRVESVYQYQCYLILFSAVQGIPIFFILIKIIRTCLPKIKSVLLAQEIGEFYLL